MTGEGGSPRGGCNAGAARLALVGVAAAVSACAAAPPPNTVEPVQQSAIVAAICHELRPNDAACPNTQLPNRASELAYSTCLDFHRLDVRACNELRATYEADLRAALSLPARSTPARSGSTTNPQPPGVQQGPVSYQTAEQLYKATSSDAQTFTAALLISDVRHKVEAALRQSLSDDRLRQMAAQSKAESLYWYGYMQRLEGAGAVRR